MVFILFLFSYVFYIFFSEDILILFKRKNVTDLKREQMCSLCSLDLTGRQGCLWGKVGTARQGHLQASFARSWWAPAWHE